MSVITFPSALSGATMKWAPRRRDVAFNSVFGSQSVGVSAPGWAVNLVAPPMKESDAGAWKALLMLLDGNVNQLELWDMQRPAPLGTMRGTMTLNGAHAQGATALSVTAGAGQASTTLKQGDLLGLGSTTTQQVVMVTADATANGSGVIAVNIKFPLRNAFSGGASVVWDKPKALFRMTNQNNGWDYAPGLITSGFSLDLIEDWRV